MSKNSNRKSINQRLTELVLNGYYKVGNYYVFSAKYVFRILDEDDELHTKDNLEKLKYCKIVISKEGDYYVIKSELIKLGMNPTDRKFIEINNLSNNL